MKLYIADYLGDTHHLTALEHGAYLLLLMAMWRSGGSLPASDDNLSRMARCTPDQWADIRGVVVPFFKRVRGRLTHKRLALEMAKYENISCKRSEAGKTGGLGKASKIKASAKAIAIFPESNCLHNQNQNQKVYNTTTINAQAPDWREMMEQAKQAAGDAADLTRPAMHHAADLKALVSPARGEPCTWAEVLDAIGMTAMRQRSKGKLIPTWKWIEADAIALRDKRLNAETPPAAEVIDMVKRAPSESIIDRIGAENAEARRRALGQD